MSAPFWTEDDLEITRQIYQHSKLTTTDEGKTIVYPLPAPWSPKHTRATAEAMNTAAMIAYERGRRDLQEEIRAALNG